MTQLLTERELKEGIHTVLRALTQGESFLLVENGRPLARLIPLPREATLQAPGRVRDVKQPLERGVTVLGETSLSRVLGLTLPTFALQRVSGTFAPPVHDRLLALSAALAEQSIGMTDPRMRAWWHRPHRELQGRSPVDHLALPWVNGDPRSTLVFGLIHRKRLLQDVALQGARP